MESNEPLVNPRRMAMILAAVYCVIGSAYIIFSSRLVSAVSPNREVLEYLETIKGFLFILLTTLLLFLFTWGIFRRIARHEKALDKYRDITLANERRVAAGLFASSAAHDIRNILMIQAFAIGKLEDDRPGPEELRRLVGQLRMAHDELTTLTRILGQAGEREMDMRVSSHDLGASLSDYVRLIRSHRKVCACQVDIEAPPRIMFCGRPALIHQMLLNLIINAADATHHQGRILVRISEPGDEDGVQIEVHDNGPGVPESDRDRILQPFYTSKKDGSGLGLLSVKICVDAHQGRLEIGTSELGGACFRIRLKNQVPDENVLVRDEAPE